MFVLLSCLEFLLSRRVKGLSHQLLVLEVNRVLKRLSIVEVLNRLNVVQVLSLSPWLLWLKRSIESLLRSLRSDQVNLSRLLHNPSQILCILSLVRLNPRLLGKVGLLKSLSLRNLV